MNSNTNLALVSIGTLFLTVGILFHWYGGDYIILSALKGICLGMAVAFNIAGLISIGKSKSGKGDSR